MSEKLIFWLLIIFFLKCFMFLFKEKTKTRDECEEALDHDLELFTPEFAWFSPQFILYHGLQFVTCG